MSKSKSEPSKPEPTPAPTPAPVPPVPDADTLAQAMFGAPGTTRPPAEAYRRLSDAEVRKELAARGVTVPELDSSAQREREETEERVRAMMARKANEEKKSFAKIWKMQAGPVVLTIKPGTDPLLVESFRLLTKLNADGLLIRALPADMDRIEQHLDRLKNAIEEVPGTRSSDA